MKRLVFAIVGLWTLILGAAFTPVQIPFATGSADTVFDLNFLNGTYSTPNGQVPPEQLISITRIGGVAQFLDSNNCWQIAPANSLRINPGKGLLVEPSRQNISQQDRDLTQAGTWTAANITAVRNQIGIDCVANTATLLTATAGGSTAKITQSRTSGAQDRIFNPFIKCVVCTGEIAVTLDDVTYYPVEAQLSTLAFTQISALQNVTNPVFGFRIANQNDSIIVDSAQLTQGRYATSPIFTTTATVTRTSDPPFIDLTPFLPFFDINRITLIFEWTQTQANTTGTMGELVNAATPTTQRLTYNFSASNTHYGVTVVGATQGCDPLGITISEGLRKMASTHDAISLNLSIAMQGQFYRVCTPSSFPTGLNRFNLGHQNDTNQLGAYLTRVRLLKNYTSTQDVLSKSTMN